MSTYVPKTAPPSPVGLHKKIFDEIRRRRGLDEEGKPIKREAEDDEQRGR